MMFAPIGSPAYDGDTDDRIRPEEAAAILTAAGYDVDDICDDGFLVYIGDHVVVVSEDEDQPGSWTVTEPARIYNQHLGRVWRGPTGNVLGAFEHATRGLVRV